MTLNANVLEDTVSWFQRAVPEPTDKNLHVQLGVHMEEFAELLQEIFSKDVTTACMLSAAKEAVRELANHLKKEEGVIAFPDRVATLDAICDGQVTGAGLAYMLNMDVVRGLHEVNRANESKFIDGQPVFNEQGKIKKGPDYQPPYLRPFV